MEGVACPMCGGKLKITIHGGEFFIREGSTLDNLNFEKIKKIDFEKGEKIDEDIMLQIEVECSVDPEHPIFGFADTSIRKEIYQRIEYGARRLRAQNT